MSVDSASPTPASAPDIAHLAHLAQVRLTAAESQALAAEIARSVENLARLTHLDLTAVAPYLTPRMAGTALRDDVVEEGLDLEAALDMAPDRAGDYFKVPQILE